LTASKKGELKTVGIEPDSFIRSVREALSRYGKDYAIGAVRGLAVRNMMSFTFPDPADGFYPIVKVHEMALRELEDMFYSYIQSGTESVSREDLIRRLVDQEVWNGGRTG
jgi:hypothetical protein